MNKEYSAGRELDKLIAEKVFGAVIDGERSSIDPAAANCWIETPHFSTDIKAAWFIVEKFVPHIRIECCATSEYYDGGDMVGQPCPWHCDIWTESNPVHCVTAETAPLAICLAALQAIGRPIE